MSKEAMAMAYAIKRKAKRMYEGGPLKERVTEDVYENNAKEDRSGRYEGYTEKPIEKNTNMEKAQQSLNKAFKFSRGGVVNDPETIVSKIRKIMHEHKSKRKKMYDGGEVESLEDEGNDIFGDNSYPDETLKEFDPLDDPKPPMFAEGGEVDKKMAAQDSLRKAFHFSEGGEAEEDPKKKRMKMIMASIGSK